MKLSRLSTKLAASSITRVLVLSILFLAACGPTDYQKPIQDFQTASNNVISADRAFLNNENSIEQNKFIDKQVFEQKPFGPDDIKKQILITPEEIKLRTDALNALSQYTTNLAQLAQGKSDSSAGQNIKSASTSLQNSSSSASSTKGTNKAQDSFNTKFSGLATAAAAGIGAVAQLIMEHKARAEIKKSVLATDKDVAELINLLYHDAQGSYLRQTSQLSAYGVQLYKDYSCEIGVDEPAASDRSEVQCPKREAGVQADPIALLTLADRLKAYQTQQTALENANPAPAIDAMKKAHTALVKYVASQNNPTNLADLIKEVQSFVSAAQPLEQAVKNLMSTSK